MKQPRPAARILLVDREGRVLLFRFTPYDGRPPFWCTPGGAVDPGETYEAAARRELLEEVGLDRDCGPQVAQRSVEFLTIEGVEVEADERYFRVDVDRFDPVTAGHTELERRVMQSWRWFAPDDLADLDEQVFPEDLAALLASTAVRPEPVVTNRRGGRPMTLPAIEQVLEPVTHDLGGFQVHRVLPARDRTMVGPFLFFDQMGPATLPTGQGIDVRPHPHINLATVTYLFDGAIDHRDSIGVRQRIEPGAVNLMTAGRGIVHSERSPAEERAHGPVLSGIQTWLALPEAVEETDPAFEHVRAADLPIIEHAGATARIIMGTLWGKRAPTTTYAGTIYAAIDLAPGAAVPIDNSADERAIYLQDGEATLDGVPLTPRQLYVLRPGVAVTLGSTTGGRAMLCGGDAFATKRHVWWNFVSSRPERIEQAKRDWRAGAFASVPEDEEFIPLPDRPLTVSYP